MTYGYDDVTFTSTLAGSTAEVQLNTATSLSAPDPAHSISNGIRRIYNKSKFAYRVSDPK